MYARRFQHRARQKVSECYGLTLYQYEESESSRNSTQVAGMVAHGRGLDSSEIGIEGLVLESASSLD